MTQSRRSRLFLALEPHAEARTGIAASRKGLTGDLRPVAADSLHVTLVFLGWREADDVRRLAAVAQEATAGKRAPFLVPIGVRAVPATSPRLFALDLGDRDGRCASVQSSLASHLSEAGLHRPERRPFWPHVTLARVKRRGHGELSKADRLPAPFVADRVVLFRSILRPRGAVYEPLWTATLDP